MKGISEHIRSLDVLRGIAIVLVMLFHAQYEIIPSYRFIDADYNGVWISWNVPLEKILLNIIPTAFGASGVELFLMISGYLIHRSYLMKKTKFNGQAFFTKRFFRIVPPYFISMLVLFPLLEWRSAWDWVLHFLMAHNLFENSFFSLNPSYWSLALEVQLYLLYPLVIVLCRRFGSNFTLMIMLMLSVATSVVGYVYFGDGMVWDKFITKFWLFWYVGAFISERHLSGKIVFRKHVLLLWMVFCIIVILKMTAYFGPIKFYLYTLFHAVLIDWFLMVRRSDSNMLVSSILHYCGLISYSLYLYHQPIMRWLIGIGRDSKYGFILLLTIIGSLLIIHVLSHISYRYVELLSMDFGKRVVRSFKR